MLYQILFGRDRTTSVTVHERPEPASDRISRAEDLKFIKDGFDWGAFILPPVFLVQHRIWLGVALYLAIASGLTAAHFAFGLPSNWTVILFAVVHGFIAWEADELRRAQLEARGWSMVGQVSGTSLLDCERRFLDGWLQTVPIKLGVVADITDTRIATDRATRGASGARSEPGRLKHVLGNLLSPRARQK